MGQTIAEKILSRKNLSGKPVRAGDIIDARLDGIMIGSSLHKLDDHLISSGIAKGVTRVWDKERVYVMTEHFQPPADAVQADRNMVNRKMAKRLAIKYFHDAVPGIHHQFMCEFGYVRPGELVLGTDSHTVMYGAINAAGTGIGEADVGYGLAFGELWFMVPTTVKIVMNGRLPKVPFAKDICLHLGAVYGDDFAQYRSIEFTGPAAGEMSLDGRMCMSAQSVEMGAKFGFFAADAKTLEYVRTRTDRPFEPADADPDAEYERVIEVQVDELPFYVSKPHHFKNGVPVSEVAGTRIDQAMIGACSNGRFEDIAIASKMIKGRKVAPNVRFMVQPVSYAVYQQCLEAGVFQDIVAAGGQVITPGCGTCHGFTGVMAEGEVTISASPRNHKGRMGHPGSFVYLGGPATVTASAIAGEIIDPTEVLSESGLI